MIKEWQGKRVMGQASPESSQRQASWGDKEGKGAYKMRGGVAAKGVQKKQKKKTQKRNRERSRIGLRVFKLSIQPFVPQENNFYINKQSFCSLSLCDQLFRFPIVEFSPFSSYKLIVKVIYLIATVTSVLTPTVLICVHHEIQLILFNLF